MPTYKIKSKVKNPAYEAARKRREQEQEAENERMESKQEMEIEKEEERKTEEFRNRLISTIEDKTSTIHQAITALKAQIAEIELETPDLDKISDSIEQNSSKQTKELKASIEQLTESVKNIKLDEKTVNIVDPNPERLSTILEDLYTQIQAIKFQAPEPVTEWDFHFERDRMGLTKKIEAKGKRTIN